MTLIFLFDTSACSIMDAAAAAAAAAAPQVVVNQPNDPDEANSEESASSSADDHLLTLKTLTEKLRLETRRPSYLEWKARLGEERLKESEPGKHPVQVGSDGKLGFHKGTASDIQHEESSLKNRFENIDEALSWLRRELVSLFFNLIYLR